MHVPSVNDFLAVAAVAGVLLAAWLLFRNRERLADLAGGWLGREQPPLPAYAVEQAQRWAADARGPDPGYRLNKTGGIGDLPDEDTRTMLLSQLAEPCPDCGGDHPGECSEMEVTEADVALLKRLEEEYGPAQVPAVDEYITGKIVGVLEDADSWHFSLGQWQPPVSLWDRLEPGDWLRELVTA